MGTVRKTAAALAAAAMLSVSMPGVAVAEDGKTSAEKLRRLDIMLMVSALRCRHSKDGFQAEYNRFASRHLTVMNAAGREIKSGLTARYGAKGAERALDRMSVGMANHYGQGHPWLSCAELKGITAELTEESDYSKLVAQADRLLADRETHYLSASYSDSAQSVE